MKSTVKYAGFAAFLRARRREKYRSARDFSVRVNLEVSYPQYSRYEAGEQLPSLQQALAIGEALRVPVLEITLEWNLAQIEHPEARNQIQGLLSTVRTGSLPAPATAQIPVPLDEVIVFNRSHRELFMKDPAYRDIFTYINAFCPYDEITAEKISKALGLELKRLGTMLENLVSLGVIVQEGRLYKAAKRNFYFPDDSDFFELRQQNLRHNLNRVLDQVTYSDLTEKRAMRALLTRELTAQQLGWVMGQMENLIGKIVDLPEDREARTIYSVCAVVGERFSR